MAAAIFGYILFGAVVGCMFTALVIEDVFHIKDDRRAALGFLAGLAWPLMAASVVPIGLGLGLRALVRSFIALGRSWARPRRALKAELPRATVHR